MKHRILWIWARIAFHAYMTLPFAHNQRSRYGRAMMWLLSWAGMYAHSRDFADFCDSPMFTGRKRPAPAGEGA